MESQAFEIFVRRLMDLEFLHPKRADAKLHMRVCPWMQGSGGWDREGTRNEVISRRLCSFCAARLVSSPAAMALEDEVAEAAVDEGAATCIAGKMTPVMQNEAEVAEVAEDRLMEHEYLGHEVVRTLSPPPRDDEDLRPWRKPRRRPKRTDVAQSEGSDSPAKKARLLEDAEAAFVAEDEGALTQNEAEVAEVAEDQGNVAQSETPPPAKKKRLLEGFWVLPFSCIQKP